MRMYSKKRGFTLLATLVCAVALFGAAALALDFGRVYITKNEAQSYADAAAVSAAMRLNGTGAGLTSADAAVAASPNSWNFATTVFTGTVVEYSADGLTGWQTSASATPSTALFARVTATVNNLPLYLLPVLNAFGGSIGYVTTVRASAVAGQVLRPPTVFPFSPVAHQVNCGTTGISFELGNGCDSTGNFGYEIGREYDLKWPTSPTAGILGDGHVPCDGDNQQQWINGLMGVGGTPLLGGVDLGPYTGGGTGTTTIESQIRDDNRSLSTLAIGAQLNAASGDKNSLAGDFYDRATSDNSTAIVYQSPLSDVYGAGTNPYLGSPDGVADIHDNSAYHTYETSSGYTGRRIITVAVRSGNGQAVVPAVDLPASEQNVILGFAQFLMEPTYSQSGGGNNPWCGTYIGSKVLYGVNHGGVQNGGVGVSYVRLTQ